MTGLFALSAAAAVVFGASNAFGKEQLVTQSGVIGEARPDMGQVGSG